MNSAYGEKIVIPGVTYVVNTVTGHTGRVHKILERFGVQVWNTKDFNRENWYWSIVTLRTPRTIKRYPRPFRFPRDVASILCHCPSGREVVEGEDVRCLKCGNFIGSESFPKRIRRAEVKYRKSHTVKSKKVDTGSKVQKGVHRPSERKATRSPKNSLKEGKNNPSGIHPVHGGAVEKNKKKSTRAILPKARTPALPKTKRVVSRGAKVSKTGQRQKSQVG